MTILNEVANINNKSLLIKEQAAQGTEIKPANTDNVTPLRPGLNGVQTLESITSDEIVGESFDEAEDITVGFGLGAGSFGSYIKPVGAGELPEVHTLMKMLFGKETVTANTSVAYSLRGTNDDDVLATIWNLRGHTVSRYIDAYMAGATFQVNATKDGAGLLQAEWRLGYLRELQTVSNSVKTARASNANGAIVVDLPKNLYDGGYVEIDGNDNSGAGWEITASGATGFTPSPNFTDALAVGDEIKPWWPSGIQRRGDILASRRGVANWGADYPNLPIKSFSVQIELNPTETEPVMKAAAVQYPEGFGYGVRQVTFQGTVDWTPRYEQFRRRANDAEKVDLSVRVGTVAGKRVTFLLKNAQILIPEVQDGATNSILSFSGKANPTAGNDSMTLTFD